MLTPAERAALPEHALDPATADAVEHYRRAMAEVFDDLGAAHLQIGRTHPYAQRRDPVTLSLLRAVKAHLDPDGLVNPGVLGL